MDQPGGGSGEGSDEGHPAPEEETGGHPPRIRPPQIRPGMFRRASFRPRRPRRPLPRLRGLPLQKLVPNAMTVLALCAGLTGIRFAMHERWEAAVLAVMTAAVLDGLDGRVARLLNAQSRFGEELDSLADMVSFGVAPAMLLYLWSLDNAGGFGWIAALALAVCCALRLARFNAGLGNVDKPAWAFNYFTGVPAPAGAGLAMLPMALSFEVGPDIAGHPLVVGFWALAVGGLMISPLPSFSFKRLRIPAQFVVPGLVGVGLLAAALVSQPWWTLSLLALAYLISLVLSVRQYRLVKAAADRMQAEAAGDVAAEGDEAEAASASSGPPPGGGVARAE